MGHISRWGRLQCPPPYVVRSWSNRSRAWGAAWMRLKLGGGKARWTWSGMRLPSRACQRLTFCFKRFVNRCGYEYGSGSSLLLSDCQIVARLYQARHCSMATPPNNLFQRIMERQWWKRFDFVILTHGWYQSIRWCLLLVMEWRDDLGSAVLPLSEAWIDRHAASNCVEVLPRIIWK